MPFKSRSQEDLAVGGASGSSSANETPGSGGTCRDDHAVAMTMTSLLLLRPDTSVPATADKVIIGAGLDHLPWAKEAASRGPQNSEGPNHNQT